MNATEARTSTQPTQALREALRALLVSSGAAVESRPWASLAVLLAVYFVAELRYSLAAPLWHDELFTFYIAQAPSISGMLARTRSIDLNPPLSYVLTRASFKLFGVGTLQCRVPEILAFALGMFGVFSFVRRRAGNSFALFAASLLFASRAGELVFQARPYGLMLGMSGLALALWQASAFADRRGNGLTELALFLVLSALLLTHVFALFAWVTIALAEAVLSFQRREIAARRLLALTLPLPATLVYIPLLRNHAQSAFPAAFQPTGSDIFIFYMGHIDRELVCLGLSAVILLLIGGKAWLRGDRDPVLSAPEWVATLGFVATPLILIGELMLTHSAFFDRYGVIACLGTAVLFCVLFYRWTGGRAGAALVAALLALLVTGRLPDAVTAVAEGQIFRHTEPVVAPLSISLLKDANTPLVAASGLAFLEMQRREPANLLHRTYYLTDPKAALAFAHATIFEGLPEEARLFQTTSRVEPYETFVSQHPVFYVLGTYDYPEEWLLRKLQADGAQLEVLGRVKGSYNDHELYRVQLPAPSHAKLLPTTLTGK